MRNRNLFCAVQIALALIISSSFAKAQSFVEQPLQRDEHVVAEQRFQQSLQKAKAGDASEQLQLSHYYRWGEGVAQDRKEADYWLQKAAENGNGDAQVEFAATLGDQRDYSSAFGWLLKAAQGGNVEGQVRLSSMYYRGLGTDVNYQEAMHWCLKAAENGNDVCAARIGLLYEKGKGVAVDYDKARQWYQLAADHGSPEGRTSLGLLYLFGRGVTQDFKEAERWLKLAAEDGFAPGQFFLASLYLDGPPVMKNPERAVSLLENSASQGHLPASAMLARVFLSDDFPAIKKDPERAIRWVKPAAEDSNKFAQRVMGLVEQTNQNYKAAEAWFLKAAQQDDGPAIFQLAQMYDLGLGVGNNFGEAAKLYIRANDLLERAEVANNAGWFFSTCKDAKYRDRELALKYALRAVELSESKHAPYLDTLAEAYFFNGQYEQAVATEEKAFELAPQDQAIRKSLARFRAAWNSGTPIQTPAR